MMMSKVLEKCFGCGVELSPYNNSLYCSICWEKYRREDVKKQLSSIAERGVEDVSSDSDWNKLLPKDNVNSTIDNKKINPMIILLLMLIIILIISLGLLNLF